MNSDIYHYWYFFTLIRKGDWSFLRHLAWHCCLEIWEWGVTLFVDVLSFLGTSSPMRKKSKRSRSLDSEKTKRTFSEPRRTEKEKLANRSVRKWNWSISRTPSLARRTEIVRTTNIAQSGHFVVAYLMDSEAWTSSTEAGPSQSSNSTPAYILPFGTIASLSKSSW